MREWSRIDFSPHKEWHHNVTLAMCKQLLKINSKWKWSLKTLMGKYFNPLLQDPTDMGALMSCLPRFWTAPLQEARRTLILPENPQVIKLAPFAWSVYYNTPKGCSVNTLLDSNVVTFKDVQDILYPIEDAYLTEVDRDALEYRRGDLRGSFTKKAETNLRKQVTKSFKALYKILIAIKHSDLELYRTNREEYQAQYGGTIRATPPAETQCVLQKGAQRLDLSKSLGTITRKWVLAEAEKEFPPTEEATPNYLKEGFGHDARWRTIWHAKATNRDTLTAYRAVRGNLSLNTRYSDPNKKRCPICKGPEETSAHLFNECTTLVPLRKQIQTYLTNEFKLPHPPSLIPCLELLAKHKEVGWTNAVVTYIAEVWKIRILLQHSKLTTDETCKLRIGAALLRLKRAQEATARLKPQYQTLQTVGSTNTYPDTRSTG
jgi:hypothetical protein